MRNNKGFTLIEVLVTITILGIFFVTLISLTSVISNALIRSTDIKSSGEKAFSDLETGGGDEIHDSITFSFGEKLNEDDVRKEYTIEGNYKIKGEGSSKLVLFQSK